MNGFIVALIVCALLGVAAMKILGGNGILKRIYNDRKSVTKRR